MPKSIFTAICLLPLVLFAQNFQPVPRPIPYFECQVPGRSQPAKLPLLDFSVDARIAGNIADVTLKQTFVNSFNSALEVKYVFPGSASSAVYGLTMIIDDRIVTAEIEEKKKARTTYENAVKDGYRASLLEQTRPNVFQMNVGNIMPSDTIVVELQYTEFIESTDGAYQLIIPTTIGQRYSGENRRGESEHVNLTYASSGESPYPININLDISSPVPIGQAKSNTHRIDLNVIDQNHWQVALNPTEQFQGNKDFILEYRLRGENLKSGILLHQGENENFFMMQIQPPKNVSLERVPPREYVFVVDVSGSMKGFPLEIAQKLMVELLDDLKPTDIFNVYLFEFSSSRLFRTSQLATPNNIKQAEKFLSVRTGVGGTNMASAMQSIYRSIDNTPISRSIILITDGQIEAEKKVFKEIRDNLNKANVFAFGIGPSVNHHLINGVAKAGMGEEFIVSSPEFAREKALALANYINRPALTNIAVNFGTNDVYDLSPTSFPDVLSNRPLTIFGKYAGKMSDDIVISGFSGSSEYTETVQPSTIEGQNNPALTYLWARKKLEDLNEFSLHPQEEAGLISAIGMQYRLLTDYTSFVAVDSEKANISQQLVTVNQPLAKPFNPTTTNSNNQNYYRSRLNATGAVSRATSSAEIQVFLPDQADYAAPKVLVRWQNNGSNLGKYTITVKNIFDNVVFSVETEQNYYWLDLSSLQDSPNLYLVKITCGDESSREIGIKYVPGAIQFNELLFDLQYRFILNDYLSAISDLRSAGLIVDACTLVEIAVMHYPDDQSLETLREEIWMNSGILQNR